MSKNDVYVIGVIILCLLIVVDVLKYQMDYRIKYLETRLQVIERKVNDL